MSMFSKAKERLQSDSVRGDSTAEELAQAIVGCVAIYDAPSRRHVRVAGTVRSLLMQPHGGVPALQARIDDGTAELTLTFLGRRQIGGIEIGRHVVVEGVVGETQRGRRMLNPVYRLL